MIKPLEGIIYNKVCPVIKDISKPSVKLTPLDLSPNDYVTDFLDQLNLKEGSKMSHEKN
jgi:hypothetical protein